MLSIFIYFSVLKPISLKQLFFNITLPSESAFHKWSLSRTRGGENINTINQKTKSVEPAMINFLTNIKGLRIFKQNKGLNAVCGFSNFCL